MAVSKTIEIHSLTKDMEKAGEKKRERERKRERAIDNKRGGQRERDR